tara:strand:- start:59 stop:1471 length:1413 start_codon:yes stop_codon:yes gene_type:complete
MSIFNFIGSAGGAFADVVREQDARRSKENAALRNTLLTNFINNSQKTVARKRKANREAEKEYKQLLSVGYSKATAAAFVRQGVAKDYYEKTLDFASKGINLAEAINITHPNLGSSSASDETKASEVANINTDDYLPYSDPTSVDIPEPVKIAGPSLTRGPATVDFGETAKMLGLKPTDTSVDTDKLPDTVVKIDPAKIVKPKIPSSISGLKASLLLKRFELEDAGKTDTDEYERIEEKLAIIKNSERKEKTGTETKLPPIIERKTNSYVNDVLRATEFNNFDDMPNPDTRNIPEQLRDAVRGKIITGVQIDKSINAIRTIQEGTKIINKLINNYTEEDKYQTPQLMDRVANVKDLQLSQLKDASNTFAKNLNAYIFYDSKLEKPAKAVLTSKLQSDLIKYNYSSAEEAMKNTNKIPIGSFVRMDSIVAIYTGMKDAYDKLESFYDLKDLNNPSNPLLYKTIKDKFGLQDK